MFTVGGLAIPYSVKSQKWQVYTSLNLFKVLADIICKKMITYTSKDESEVDKLKC